MRVICDVEHGFGTDERSTRLQDQIGSIESVEHETGMSVFLCRKNWYDEGGQGYQNEAAPWKHPNRFFTLS
jgi:hypothetical protein